jgi:MbtH protein
MFKVVINHEEQYSLYPANRDNPHGWIDAGFVGTKKECLDYIEKNWEDLRPKSIRDESVKKKTDQ